MKRFFVPDDGRSHHVGSDFEPVEKTLIPHQRPSGQKKGFRHNKPFGDPNTTGALVLMQRQFADLFAALATETGDGFAELGGALIAFVLHGGRGAAPFLVAFTDFADIGGGEQVDVVGDLGERRAESAKGGNDIGKGVARILPVRLGKLQPQGFGDALLQF